MSEPQVASPQSPVNAGSDRIGGTPGIPHHAANVNDVQVEVPPTALEALPVDEDGRTPVDPGDTQAEVATPEHESPAGVSANRDETGATIEPMTPEETALFMSSVEEVDVTILREMGLLRRELEVSTDRCALDSFGQVSDHGRNLATVDFESRTALQSRCREFARRTGFSLRVANNSWHKERREGNAKYVCKLLKGQQQLTRGTAPNCPFHFTIYGIRDQWKITKMCLAHDHYRNAGFQEDTFVEGELADDTGRQRQRDMPFTVLRGIVEREMLPAYSGSWATVKGKAITDFLKSKQITTNRQTASKIKRQLLDVLRGNMVESYQKLESFLIANALQNHKSHHGFEKTEDGLFQRACFFPSACLLAVQFCRHVVGLDGTHLKGDMNKRGVFLLATTKDLNGHIVVFGLALVGQEDYSNWRWFLREMKSVLTVIENMWNPVFVSDRQKGLLASVTEIYPNSGHRYCVRHIISNIEKKGSALTPSEQAIIFQMTRSECENDYNYYSSRLRDTRPLAVEYLDGIDKSHWVTYAFSEAHNQPSYDEVTSNLSEAANNWLGNSCRTSYPLQAFEQYAVKVVEQLAARRRDVTRPKAKQKTPGANSHASPGSQLPDQLAVAYKDKLDGMLALSKSLHIVPCLQGQYRVRFTDVSTRPDHLHMWRTVNLHDRECTCRRWQDEQFPCVHAVKAAIHHGMHVTELFDISAHTVEAYRNTYFFQFVPHLTASGLQLDTALRIPEVIVQEEELGKRGRKPGPKSKHKRKSARPGSAASPSVAMTQ